MENKTSPVLSRNFLETKNAAKYRTLMEQNVTAFVGAEQ